MQVREILRSHPFWLFLPVAALLVVAAPSLAFFTFDREAATATQLGLSTAGLFALLLGLAAGAGAVARDRARGAIDVLFARSLSPGSYVFGKWLGIVIVVGLAVAVLGSVHMIALARRGGPPEGYGVVAAALVAAAVSGALAAAAGVFFSTLFRSGPAFVLALLFLLLTYLLPLLPPSTPVSAALDILPRLPSLHLGVEAAFGPWSGRVFLLAVLHALLYSSLLLVLAAPLAARPQRGKT